MPLAKQGFNAHASGIFVDGKFVLLPWFCFVESCYRAPQSTPTVLVHAM